MVFPITGKTQAEGVQRIWCWGSYLGLRWRKK